MSDNQKWSILQGDALKVLGTFDPNTFDAVITDPPYASGGRTQAEKNKSTAQKYSSMGENAPPPFDGDAKDQRSWTRWAAEWLYEARKASKPGAPVCMFIDWRQLPAATDALQWAGWIWRGTAVWDKGNSRPQKGRFRQQAEYIVWVPMAICLSAVRCPACQGCSSMAIHRAAFILRRNPCSLCGTL